MCCLAHSLNLGFVGGILTEVIKSQRKAEKKTNKPNTHTKQISNKIWHTDLSHLLALELLWCPWQFVALPSLHAQAIRFYLHECLPTALLQLCYRQAVVKYRTGTFSESVTSSLFSVHAQVLSPFFLASSHPFKFQWPPYHAIFAQEINSFEGIRESCCCGLPFPLLQCVNNSPARGAAHQLRWQSGVPGFNPVTQCIVI